MLEWLDNRRLSHLDKQSILDTIIYVRLAIDVHASLVFCVWTSTEPRVAVIRTIVWPVCHVVCVAWWVAAVERRGLCDKIIYTTGALCTGFLYLLDVINIMHIVLSSFTGTLCAYLWRKIDPIFCELCGIWSVHQQCIMHTTSALCSIVS